MRGHIGESYGLISEYGYCGNYSYSYAINGARNGYHYINESFYER